MLPDNISKTTNNKMAQSYGLDCALFNAIRDKHMKDFYGVRMAFYLGDSITQNGNIF